MTTSSYPSPGRRPGLVVGAAGPPAKLGLLLALLLASATCSIDPAGPCHAADDADPACGACGDCEGRGRVCEPDSGACLSTTLSETASAQGDFAGLAAPLFRAEVCLPATARPGDAIPVQLITCTHPCLTVHGFSFKKQYRCDDASTCEAVVIAYYPMVDGHDCPADVFGAFPTAACHSTVINASAGPFIIDGTAISGGATIEIPLLSNADAAAIRDGASVDAIWDLIYQYAPQSDRIFAVELGAQYQGAPVDCASDGCVCHKIGL